MFRDPKRPTPGFAVDAPSRFPADVEVVVDAPKIFPAGTEVVVVVPNMSVRGAEVVAVDVPKRLAGFEEPKSPPDCGPCEVLPGELHSRFTIS